MPRWLDAGRLRGIALDRRGARALHDAVRHRGLRWALTLASRLGDAPMWIVLLLVMPLLDPVDGTTVAQRMLMLGSVNYLVYASLKRATRRQRPFEQCAGICAGLPPPDAFSFPSGHTLHAVAFGVLLSAFYPALAPLLGVFALAVGMSRVVLGLHYPSDVLIGAGLGIATASLLLYLGA
ncbi:MAG: phosphatase PAP2 family protein [Burkholderiaceae bacterium]